MLARDPNVVRLAPLYADPVFDVSRDRRHQFLELPHLLDGPMPSVSFGRSQGLLKAPS
jgi:hypothetical protein